jgi:hypothetical protein|tara:strand:- start:1059 stop:1178 length:120 start_codon:yes stop_codon:yes gene_type:complete
VADNKIEENIKKKNILTGIVLASVSVSILIAYFLKVYYG